MPKTPQDLFAFLDGLGIRHQTVEHAPVYTAADEIDWKNVVPGLHCKNLFVENRESRKWLITMPAADRADMNGIGKQLNSGRLSFVKSEHMLGILGVPPGHATPFAMLNDSARNVNIAVDEAIPMAPAINIHPLVNTASTIISGADLMHFFRAFGITPTVIKTAKVNAAA
ncbi:MAG: prolyl-tRNA synthetase associated domain-containing protein [Bdellovibrionales bacterium]